LEVAKALAFSNFTSIDKLTRTFDEKVNELYKKLTSSSSGGGAGSGGGGGGGSGTVYTNENSGSKENINKPETQNPEVQNSEAFIDLQDALWAKESINEFAKRGIVNGVDGLSFMPNKTITREEFVKVMVMALGLDNTVIKNENPFNDVSQSQWYYKYIAISNQLGIVNGKTDKGFGVGENLTRQDLATICYRAAKSLGIKLPNANSEYVFNDDNQIYDYAKEAVYSLEQAGIIAGLGDNTFAPNNFATRAQAVKIMYMITEYSK